MDNDEMNEYKCKECLHYVWGKCGIKDLKQVNEDDSCENIHPTAKAYLEHNKF